ncbi:hypothetical protein JCM10512_1413 [Bacteroides reticulotermitis JCM 10512]|uniref:Uncharacterized protein n=1 Tax=Bacteroides reticulotermitis JCM 10512 TaxID=1445607 RepID=W4URA5_9BACE|nr:hypothetical protein JCM10512_1413 [Bacteroides reticulotermitis JCM 10512]
MHVQRTKSPGISLSYFFECLPLIFYTSFTIHHFYIEKTGCFSVAKKQTLFIFS